MDALLARGFLNWDKRDFLKFKQALELYPREDVDDIAGHIGTKTREEIQAYQAVFYANVDTLNEAAKIKKVLERCTGIHNFKKSAPLLIKTKVTAVERPLDEMVINPIQKSKYFSKEAEIVLLCLTHEHGYGNWTEIKHAIRRDPRVRFDHLLMSRSEVELQRRVDILVKTIEKEIE
jgi:SWI/SNF-related matrix-associated actin-dependent regulator of chromatin subfamily A member 5